MDIPTLAATVTSFLTPALPYLVKAGEKGSEIIGEKLGAGVWETAKAIWQRLSPNPLVQSAAQEVADAPDDPDAQEILRLQLKKILKADESLAAALAQLMETAAGQSASYHAEVHGEGAIAQAPGAVAAGKEGTAVGRDLHGGVRIGSTQIIGTQVNAGVVSITSERVPETSESALRNAYLISMNTFNSLRRALLQCGPFESNQKLRAVFAHPLLQPWQIGLPEAENVMARVDILIDYLKNAHRNTGEPILPIFLRILAERNDPQNLCYRLLSDLAEDLAHSYAPGKVHDDHPRSGDAPGEAAQHPHKDFFVSYNGADLQWAEWIAWQLEAAGYSTVIQAWDFRPGSNFVLEMQKASEQAERTIAVLSLHYVQALYTQPEWAAAFAQDPTGAKRQLVPVRVKPCELKGLLAQIVFIDLVDTCELKGLLAQIVFIDLVDLRAEAARDKLLAGVDYNRAKPAVAPGFPGLV